MWKITAPLPKYQPSLLNQLHAFYPDGMRTPVLRKGLEYPGEEGSSSLQLWERCSPFWRQTLSGQLAALESPRISSTNAHLRFVNKTNKLTGPPG